MVMINYYQGGEEGITPFGASPLPLNREVELSRSYASVWKALFEELEEEVRGGPFRIHAFSRPDGGIAGVAHGAVAGDLA